MHVYYIWIWSTSNRANNQCISELEWVWTTVGLLETMIVVNHGICSEHCFSIVFIWIFHTTPLGHTLQNESKNLLKRALQKKPICMVLKTYAINTIEVLLLKLSCVYRENSVMLIPISTKNHQKFKEKFCFRTVGYQNMNNHHHIL